MEKRERAILNRLITGLFLSGLLFFSVGATDIVLFTDITPGQASTLIAEKGADPLFVILDVRTAEEFSTGRIKGSLNVDIRATNFKEKIEKLDRSAVYLVVCRGGVRSAHAMNLMKEWGFQAVYNLGGGLMQWQAENLPIETDAGQSQEPSEN